jgi:polysaccharide export outer membrane protein
VTAASRFPALRLVTFQERFVNHNRCKPRARRDRVTLTHTDASGSTRTAVPRGTAPGPGDTVLVGERWLWAQSEFIG